MNVTDLEIGLDLEQTPVCLNFQISYILPTYFRECNIMVSNFYRDSAPIFPPIFWQFLKALTTNNQWNISSQSAQIIYSNLKIKKTGTPYLQIQNGCFLSLPTRD